MACTKEINQEDNLLTSCPEDTDEVIIIRKISDVYQPFRVTWADVKDCLIAPPAIAFTVGDPSLVDTADITYPLGGGTTFFSSSLIGRKSVIVFVNNSPIPRLPVQEDYFTPDFTTGEIVRPITFTDGDYVEIIPL